MATVKTTRLNLAKQAAGDNPGSWEVDMNQGYQDADDRFFLSGAGDPNTAGGGVTSNYIGQRYLDTDTDLWWTAQDAAAPGTWVSDQDMLLLGRGMCTGRLERGSDSTLILKPAYGTIIYTEVDGVIVSHSGNLTFDLATDYFEGSETASETVYLYVQNNAGVLTAQLSDQPPDDIGDTKPGYSGHTNTYRCIGSWWNGSDGHLVEGQYDRDGWFRFNSVEGTDHLYNQTAELTLTGQSDYRSLTLNLPKTATNVQLAVLGYGADDWYMALARSDAAAATLPTGSAGPPWKLSNSNLVDAVAVVQSENARVADASTVIMPIADRTAPALKYGHNHSKDPTVMEFVTKGYQDMWAPKGY
jgi:hypothetical protein